MTVRIMFLHEQRVVSLQGYSSNVILICACCVQLQACLLQAPKEPLELVSILRLLLPFLFFACSSFSILMTVAVTFRESIPIGVTDLSPQEVYEVVQQLGQTYKGNQYHLLEMNCNTFSNELCYRLTGKFAPAWVSFSERSSAVYGTRAQVARVQLHHQSAVVPA